MFYLIFQYRTTVSPCIDIVTGIFLTLPQWRLHEQSLVAVQKRTEICIKRHWSQLWHIIKRLSVKLLTMENYSAAEAFFWLLN